MTIYNTTFVNHKLGSNRPSTDKVSNQYVWILVLSYFLDSVWRFTFLIRFLQFKVRCTGMVYYERADQHAKSSVVLLSWSLIRKCRRWMTSQSVFTVQNFRKFIYTLSYNENFWVLHRVNKNTFLNRVS